MANMTLDEAIKHSREIAKSHCDQCGSEHALLASWLEELVVRRKEADELKQSIDKWRARLNELLLDVNYSGTHRDKRQACEEIYHHIKYFPSMTTFNDGWDIPF